MKVDRSSCRWKHLIFIVAVLNSYSPYRRNEIWSWNVWKYMSFQWTEHHRIKTTKCQQSLRSKQLDAPKEYNPVDYVIITEAKKLLIFFIPLQKLQNSFYT